MGIALLAVALLISLKTVVDSGEFKKIEPHFNGECQEIFGLEGPEDIIILSDSTAIISADPRRKILSETSSIYSYEEKNEHSNQGSIFLYNLNNQELINMTLGLNFEFHPHGISNYITDKGDIYISAINHTSGGHFVEFFILKNNKLVSIKRVSDPLLVSPNDLVMVDHNQFYITNDHSSKSLTGKLIEDYLQLSRSNVLFYDGSEFVISQKKMQYANGINISHNQDKVFVSETIGQKVSIYTRDIITNKLTYESSIAIDSGLDNIELDRDGNLWIGSHPKLFDFVKHAKNSNHLSPSQVIKIFREDYNVQEVYLSDGHDLSGSSVATVINNNLLIGAVFEDHFLHCFIDE